MKNIKREIRKIIGGILLNLAFSAFPDCSFKIKLALFIRDNIMSL